MLKVVVLGAGGTVGREFCSFVEREAEVELLRWNRHQMPLTDFEVVSEQLEILRPDYVFNFAIASDGSSSDSEKLNLNLPELLAKLSRSLQFKFIQTSSVMVFHDNQQGPHTVDTVPLARDGYGLEKRRMEEKVLGAKGNALVIRLGWQIGKAAGSNNMVDYLEKLSAKGVIKASNLWFPSCSSLSETVQILWSMREFSPDLYQLNTNEGDSFFALIHRLRQALKKTHWLIEESNEFSGNQLMIDPRIPRCAANEAFW